MVKCVDDASVQTMSCLQRKRQNSVTFSPFSGRVRPQQSTRGESIYRPIGRRNVKNAPGPESACG